MADYLIDILFTLVVAATAYFVARQLFVDAAILFISTLIASQFAIGTFEVVTLWVQEHWFLTSDAPFTIYLWSFFLIGLFVSVAFLLVCFANAILPNPPEFSHVFENFGCWIVGIVTGYLLASFLLAAAHTLPASRDFWGAFPPEVERRRGPIARIAPDYQFLILTEYVCEHASPTGRGKWLLDQPVTFMEPSASRWRSFPIRFAKWRERIEMRREAEANWGQE